MNEIEQALLYGVAIVTILTTLVLFVWQYFRKDD